jgi:uncharacterized BrkB/YihY/UPF0761 family membrane protein
MAMLPPDFWTKPQPGGLTGIYVGAAIAGVLWYYFFFAAYWKTSYPSLKNTGWLMVAAIMGAVGCILGSIIGPLIVLGLSRY